MEHPQQLEFLWEENAPAPAPAPKAPQQPASPSPRRHPRVYDRAAREALQARLRTASGLRVHLRINDNASTVMSVRAVQDGLRLSLHHMFLAASPEVIAALGAWLQNPRRRRPGRVIDEFIEARRHEMQPGRKRRVTLDTEGANHDLVVLFTAVNEQHFGGTITARVTWGRMPTILPKRRRSIRFGSYNPGQNLIRIHPLLDQEFVPRYFVR